MWGQLWDEAGGPGALRRRVGPACSAPGRPPPGVRGRDRDLYLHRAEPQQVSHDSTAATTQHDMAPGEPPPKRPGLARSRVLWSRSPAARANTRACQSLQRAPAPAALPSREDICWGTKPKPVLRSGKIVLFFF